MHAATGCDIRLYWSNRFDTVRWRRAERHFLSRWLISFWRMRGKLSSPEL
jgi:hypothetical protein